MSWEKVKYDDFNFLMRLIADEVAKVGWQLATRRPNVVIDDWYRTVTLSYKLGPDGFPCVLLLFFAEQDGISPWETNYETVFTLDVLYRRIKVPTVPPTFHEVEDEAGYLEGILKWFEKNHLRKIIPPHKRRFRSRTNAAQVKVELRRFKTETNDQDGAARRSGPGSSTSARIVKHEPPSVKQENQARSVDNVKPESSSSINLAAVPAAPTVGNGDTSRATSQTAAQDLMDDDIDDGDLVEAMSGIEQQASPQPILSSQSFIEDDDDDFLEDCMAVEQRMMVT